MYFFGDFQTSIVNLYDMKNPNRKENNNSVIHCETRLRFKLKDQSLGIQKC
jgi:hypothetical protein